MTDDYIQQVSSTNDVVFVDECERLSESSCSSSSSDAVNVVFDRLRKVVVDDVLDVFDVCIRLRLPKPREATSVATKMFLMEFLKELMI